MTRHTHIGVYGLIFNNDKVLLIKKGRGPYTGKYDLPGGKIEFGEMQIEALKREINEETGLNCISIELIDGISNTLQWINENKEIEELHHLGFIYKVEVNYKEPIKDEYDGHDSLGAEWIDLKTTDMKTLSPFAYKALINYI